jgi:hypothetical protein
MCGAMVWCCLRSGQLERSLSQSSQMIKLWKRFKQVTASPLHLDAQDPSTNSWWIVGKKSSYFIVNSSTVDLLTSGSPTHSHLQALCITFTNCDITHASPHSLLNNSHTCTYTHACTQECRTSPTTFIWADFCLPPAANGPRWASIPGGV